MDIPSCQPSSTQQYSPINEKPGGGFQRAPTDAALEPAPSTKQYSPINEKPGGGFQRAPTAAALEPAHLPAV